MAIDELQGGFDLTGVGLALALGLLVGIQRGWAHREEAPGSQFAGVRTFGLLGLAGGIAGAIYAWAQAIAVIVLAATAILVLISYYRVSQRQNLVSGTGSLVGLLTMGCGFLAATGYWLSASVITGSMVLLLSLRTRLHHMVERLSEKDIRAIAHFTLIAMVILPLLPDRAYGPYDAWNPQKLWFVVVLVSGFSLAGYVATRLLGARRGTIAMAAAGSMVSSTAVTATLANRMRDEETRAPILDAGIAAASAVMFLRIIVLVTVLAPFALPTLSIMAVSGMAVSVIATILLLRAAKDEPVTVQDPVDVKNPAAIGPALVLVGLVMVMTLAARWVLEHYGDAELAIVLAISGTVDVDSAVITMGSLPSGTLAPRMAGFVLLAPMVLNTLFKATVAVSIAGWKRSLRGVVTLALSALASLAAAALLAF